MNIKALTLLEIIVATVILALVATGLGNIFISSGQWLFHTRAVSTAAELGNNFLEPLLMQVNQTFYEGNLAGTSCLTGSTGNCNAAFPATNIAGIIFTPTYVTSAIPAPAPAGYPYGQLRKVVLTVQWPTETRY